MKERKVMEDGRMNKKEALEAFQLEGKVISAERYGSGHINDTFLVTLLKNDGSEGVQFCSV